MDLKLSGLAPLSPSQAFYDPSCAGSFRTLKRRSPTPADFVLASAARNSLPHRKKRPRHLQLHQGRMHPLPTLADCDGAWPALNTPSGRQRHSIAHLQPLPFRQFRNLYYLPLLVYLSSAARISHEDKIGGREAGCEKLGEEWLGLKASLVRVSTQVNPI